MWVKLVTTFVGHHRTRISISLSTQGWVVWGGKTFQRVGRSSCFSQKTNWQFHETEERGKNSPTIVGHIWVPIYWFTGGDKWWWGANKITLSNKYSIRQCLRRVLIKLDAFQELLELELHRKLSFADHHYSLRLGVDSNYSISSHHQGNSSPTYIGFFHWSSYRDWMEKKFPGNFADSPLFHSLFLTILSPINFYTDLSKMKDRKSFSLHR